MKPQRYTSILKQYICIYIGCHLDKGMNRTMTNTYRSNTAIGKLRIMLVTLIVGNAVLLVLLVITAIVVTSLLVLYIKTFKVISKLEGETKTGQCMGKNQFFFLIVSMYNTNNALWYYNTSVFTLTVSSGHRRHTKNEQGQDPTLTTTCLLERTPNSSVESYRINHPLPSREQVVHDLTTEGRTRPCSPTPQCYEIPALLKDNGLYETLRP